MDIGVISVIGLVALLVWVIVLTIVVIRIDHHYKRLTKGINKQSLQTVLDAILSNEKHTETSLLATVKRVTALEHDVQKTIQKIGIIRFNPFGDTGGEQSFAIALLDIESTGVVISSLFGRSQTRWYIKQVQMGKALDQSMSKEEQEAVKKAVHL